jgi:hypothetical protein
MAFLITDERKKNIIVTSLEKRLAEIYSSWQDEYGYTIPTEEWNSYLKAIRSILE